MFWYYSCDTMHKRLLAIQEEEILRRFGIRWAYFLPSCCSTEVTQISH